MLVEIDRFLRRTGMTKAALGSKALGDHRAIRLLFEGQRDLTDYTEKRLRRWMAEHPDGVKNSKPGRPRKEASDG